MILCPNNLEYLPYQLEGIEFSMNKRFSLIADEMGLGKTIQAIGWINSHPEIESVIIVCPASLKINWQREWDKWVVSPFVDVTIINYDILHKHDMRKIYDLCIADEAHYLSNKSAKRSRYCRQIRAKNKIALTGTPVMNKPIGLWHILHWLNPTEWPMKSYMRYALRYCGAYRGHWGWVLDGASHLDELKDKLKPLMIRRLKVDVLKDLPEKRRQIIELPVNGINPDLKKRMVEAKRRIEQIEETYASDIRKMHTALEVAWQDMAKLRHETGLYKAEMALELIKDSLEASGKVVVFAHHRDVLERIHEVFKKESVLVHGGTPLKVRQENVDKFQREVSCKLFVGQIQAAGTGITLTASSHVIFIELDWSPLMFQAEDRCHRIGQKESVLIQHLCLEDSIDVKMAKALMRKQSVVEKLLN